MLKKVLAMVLVCMLAFSVILTGCGEKASTDNTNTPDATDAPKGLKVGFIYVGPVGDGGWTYAHNEGRLYLEEQLGAQGVETTYRESVSDQNADSEEVMRDMIDQGVNVIFGTSYGYAKYMEKMAKEYPDVKFLHCSGNIMNDTNMSKYFGRMYEPRYLSGIVAGLKTKTNKLGYVAAYETPEVISGINAFTLGAQSVNPDVKVVVKWTHTWYDPALEKDAAVALLDEGADVIAQHQDTTGPQVAAEEKGVWAVGYNTDSRDAAPKAYMTAPIWNWGPYYVDQVKAILDGTWKTSDYYGGMNDGIIDLAPLTDVAPADAKAKVEEMTAKIKDGTFKVFEGPIKDQSGAEKVAAGQSLTDEEILGMMWFVQGVEGKIAAQN